MQGPKVWHHKIKCRRRPQGRNGPIKRILGDTPMVPFSQALAEALERERVEFIMKPKEDNVDDLGQ